MNVSDVVFRHAFGKSAPAMVLAVNQSDGSLTLAFPKPKVGRRSVIQDVIAHPEVEIEYDVPHVSVPGGGSRWSEAVVSTPDASGPFSEALPSAADLDAVAEEHKAKEATSKKKSKGDDNV